MNTIKAAAVIFVLAIMVAGAGWLDRQAVPQRARAMRPPVAAHLLGSVVMGWLWLLWLGLSARPFFAAAAALATLAVFVLISRVKHAYLREPLVFSDLGFLPTLLRHPDLFYLGRASAAGLGLAVIVLGGLIAAWTSVEPSALGGTAQLAALALALLVAAGFALRPAGLAGVLASLEKPLMETPANVFVGTLGLSVSLVAGFVFWRRDGKRAGPGGTAGVPAGESPYRAVIILQAESFADLRREGVPLDLPNLDRLRRGAMAHGRLEVSCYGAYTHRSEVEMLTGVPFARQRMDRFDPYLRPQKLAPASLARALGGAGWRTVFLHPHDARFFRRDRAIPRLGFARFIGEEAFAPGDRFGPYVGDRAVARRIVEEIRAASTADEPLFLMSVSMEAHDPYGPGRLSGIADPVQQYARHLANADAMLGTVAAALDALTDRSLLVFYGDHAPILPGHEGLADDTATDYLVLECGWAAKQSARTSSTCSPAGINGLLRSLLAAGRQPATGRGVPVGRATTSMMRSTMEK